MKKRNLQVSRRSFLGASTAAAAAAVGAMAARPLFAAATPVPAAAEPVKKLGWAMVGVGSLTMNQILPAIAKSKYVKLAGLVSGHPDKAKAQAQKYGLDPKFIYSYENYESIKDNPDIDVMYIVLPNGMHAEYTIRAAKAGKHVLCEKPMANTVEECQAMIDACKAAGKKLMVAYRMQYEPMTLKAIDIARNQLGGINQISSESGFSAVNNRKETWWRLDKKLAGGGPLMDMGIYGLQATRFLSGEEPSLVSATMYQPANSPAFAEVEETMQIQMQFPSGMMASLLTTYGFGCNRVRAYGKRGTMEMEPMQQYSNNHLYYPVRGSNRTEVPYDVVDHFALEMDDFCKCIQANKESKTPGEEGLRDMKVMMAAYESARSGKAVKLA